MKEVSLKRGLAIISPYLGFLAFDGIWFGVLPISVRNFFSENKFIKRYCICFVTLIFTHLYFFYPSLVMFLQIVSACVDLCLIQYCIPSACRLDPNPVLMDGWLWKYYSHWTTLLIPIESPRLSKINSLLRKSYWYILITKWMQVFGHRLFLSF